MPRMPRVTAMEAIRAIRKDGWVQASARSTSHRQFNHPTKPGTVTVPVHSGTILPPKVLTSIVRQAALTMSQFRNLL